MLEEAASFLLNYKTPSQARGVVESSLNFHLLFQLLFVLGMIGVVPIAYTNQLTT